MSFINARERLRRFSTSRVRSGSSVGSPSIFRPSFLMYRSGPALTLGQEVHVHQGRHPAGHEPDPVHLAGKRLEHPGRAGLVAADQDPEHVASLLAEERFDGEPGVGILLRGVVIHPPGFQQGGEQPPGLGNGVAQSNAVLLPTGGAEAAGGDPFVELSLQFHWFKKHKDLTAMR